MTDAVVKQKKTRKKSVLEIHRLGECGCSISSNPTQCIYQSFLDGWEFTPDVGNGQKRGEVFTPRWVVDKMVKDVGLFPEEAVYNLDYSTLSKEEALQAIHAKVLEPAVGTGNYISTILWHKIEYANFVALDTEGILNVEYYHQLLLTAISSIYVFDIDAGNLTTTRRRLFYNNSLSNSINSPLNISQWTNYISANTQTSQSIETLQNIIKESLDSAEANWSNFLNSNPVGVVGKLYEIHTEKTIPDEIAYHVDYLLNRNVKLFNGIVKEDTDSETFVCPGWKNVVWNWWTISEEDNRFNIESEEVRLADQMISGEIEQLEKRMKTLKEEKMKESDEGLFSVINWVDKTSELEYKKLEKHVAKLKKELNNN